MIVQPAWIWCVPDKNRLTHFWYKSIFQYHTVINRPDARRQTLSALAANISGESHAEYDWL